MDWVWLIFSSSPTAGLAADWEDPTLTPRPSTALPTKRKRRRFCLILKKKSRCLGGICLLIRQWSGCPGEVVGSCCTMCCAGEDCQVDSEPIPPSCHLGGWSIILISFLKINFLTVPNMAFWKKKKVFILPPTTLYVLNRRRKTKTKKPLPNQRLLFLRHRVFIAHGRRLHLLSHNILCCFLLKSFILLDPFIRFVF